MGYKVTVDVSADMKALRRIEADGLIEIYVVKIENFKDSPKIKRRRAPIAIIDGPFSFIDKTVIAADDTPYWDLQRIIGKEHHADILHLEYHLQSGHSFFITEDTDFLSKRDELQAQLGAKILTPTEPTSLLKENPH